MNAAARARAEAAFADEGLQAHTWSNQPGYLYAEHSHDYHKVLYCLSGSIVFHTSGGDLPLQIGERLDLPPHTPHSATVGDEGVTCMEAARSTA